MDKSIEEATLATLADAQDTCDARKDLGRVGQASKTDEPDPIGKVCAHKGCYGQRQPRLAHSTRSGEGHQRDARIEQHPSYLSEFPGTADEVGPRPQEAGTDVLVSGCGGRGVGCGRAPVPRSHPVSPMCMPQPGIGPGDDVPTVLLGRRQVPMLDGAANEVLAQPKL